MGHWLRGATALGVCCCVLMITADRLFYDQPMGWTVGLFIALVVLALWARKGRGLHRSFGGKTGLAMTAGLVAALFEYPAILAVLVAAVTLVSLAILSRHDFRVPLSVWVGSVGHFFVLGWTRFFIDSRLIPRWLLSRSGRSAQQIRGLLHWVAAAGLSMIFVLLFWLANPVITGWASDLGELFHAVTANRILLWSLVLVWSWALLRGRGRRRRMEMVMRDGVVHFVPRDRVKTFVAPKDPLAGWLIRVLSPQLVVRCLVAFNAVFAVQTVLDVMYLFGGAQLPDGMTYAQYAHRGAYPLIVTALLAAMLVLVTFRPGSQTQNDPWCRRLVYLWLGQNVFLTIGSLWRLGLYMDAYSLTRWRLAAGIWMGLVGVGLVLIVAKIVAEKSNAWLVRTNMMATLAVLYVCCFLNLDGFIANYNVRHCRQITGTGQPLDLRYLEQLGPDALPAMEAFLHHAHDPLTDPLFEDAVLKSMSRLKQKLKGDLSDWRGWSYRRQRLADRFLSNEPPNRDRTQAVLSPTFPGSMMRD